MDLVIKGMSELLRSTPTLEVMAIKTENIIAIMGPTYGITFIMPPKKPINEHCRFQINLMQCS